MGDTRRDADEVPGERWETDDLDVRSARETTARVGQARPATDPRDGAGSQQDTDALAGSGAAGRVPMLLGGYQVVGQLGAGAMGTVYRAREMTSGREVALKVVQLAGMPAARRERFRREAQLAARVTHRSVVRVFAYDESADLAWIASELVHGRTLRSELGRAPREQRVAWVAQVADALGAVHAAGIVHRDVKPENALVDEQGVVRLTDFGISLARDETERLTLTGRIVGTTSYLAPEQARGEREIGPGADVWALGVILFEALTLQHPFDQGAGLGQLLYGITEGNFDPPRKLDPSVPRALEAVCLKALAAEPSARYADGAEFAQALRGWEGGGGAAARGLRTVGLLACGALIGGLVTVAALRAPSTQGPSETTSRLVEPAAVKTRVDPGGGAGLKPLERAELERRGRALVEGRKHLAGLTLLEQAQTPSASALAGALLRRGLGGGDLDRAEEHLRRAAAGGVALGQRELAMLLLAEQAQARRSGEAAALLREAARGGDPIAKRIVEEERAARPRTGALVEQARQGDPIAMDQLAKKLADGKEGRRSSLRAHALWRRAIRVGAPRARIALGRLHETRFKDKAGGTAWVLRALRDPDLRPRALALLAGFNHDLILTDDAAWLRRYHAWLEEACANDDPNALFIAGKIWADGLRVPKDEAKGRALLLRSSKLGKDQAMIRLARMLRDGKGGPKDRFGAILWGERALALGQEAGQDVLSGILSDSSSTDAEAQRAMVLLRQWAERDKRPVLWLKLGRLLCGRGDATQWREGLKILRNLGPYENAKRLHNIFVKRGPAN